MHPPTVSCAFVELAELWRGGAVLDRPVVEAALCGHLLHRATGKNITGIPPTGAYNDRLPPVDVVEGHLGVVIHSPVLQETFELGLGRRPLNITQSRPAVRDRYPEIAIAPHLVVGVKPLIQAQIRLGFEV